MTLVTGLHSPAALQGRMSLKCQVDRPVRGFLLTSEILHAGGAAMATHLLQHSSQPVEIAVRKVLGFPQV